MSGEFIISCLILVIAGLSGDFLYYSVISAAEMSALIKDLSPSLGIASVYVCRRFGLKLSIMSMLSAALITTYWLSVTASIDLYLYSTFYFLGGFRMFKESRRSAVCGSDGWSSDWWDTSLSGPITFDWLSAPPLITVPVRLEMLLKFWHEVDCIIWQPCSSWPIALLTPFAFYLLLLLFLKFETAVLAFCGFKEDCL